MPRPDVVEDRNDGKRAGHDPKGSHYRDLRGKDRSGIAMTVNGRGTTLKGRTTGI